MIVNYIIIIIYHKNISRFIKTDLIQTNSHRLRRRITEIRTKNQPNLRDYKIRKKKTGFISPQYEIPFRTGATAHETLTPRSNRRRKYITKISFLIKKMKLLIIRKYITIRDIMKKITRLVLYKMNTTKMKKTTDY